MDQFLFKIHDIANNDFIPCSPFHYGIYYDMSKELNTLEEAIKTQRHMMVCINDTPEITKDIFEHAKKIINAAFETILPEKSSFEI